MKELKRKEKKKIGKGNGYFRDEGETPGLI
jgi:hypothetical protein